MTGATLDVSPCHYLYAYPIILSIPSCHSERQRRIWRTHFMYIIVPQILHSACGSV